MADEKKDRWKTARVEAAAAQGKPRAEVRERLVATALIPCGAEVRIIASAPLITWLRLAGPGSRITRPRITLIVEIATIDRRTTTTSPTALSIKRESFRESLHQLSECSGLFVSIDEGESASDTDHPISITVQWSKPGVEEYTLHAVTSFDDFAPFEAARTVAKRMREVEQRQEAE